MNYSSQNQNQYGQSQFGNQNIDYTQSRYGGPSGQQQTPYDNKNSQFRGSDSEIKGLFDAFQRNGKVDLREFLDILASTGMNKKCSILVDKINGHKHLREVDAQTFASLFQFDLANRDDFMHTFKAIDKSQSFSIGPSELEAASQNYDLNLKKDDIKLMIENLKQSNVDSVTADELYNALYKQN